MKSIYDFVTSKEIATYWTELKNERKPYFGESKFPNEKKLGLDLSWIKGAKNTPVALQLSAFDAKVIPISRQGFEKLSTNMPFFKNSAEIDEKQRQELLQVMASGNQAAIDIIIGRIFDDKSTLLENAAVAREIMRMQILTTGSIAIESNGQNYKYDFGVPDKNKVTPNVKWNLENADPISDIISWQDQIEESTGTRPTELLINGKTFDMIAKTAAVKNAIYVMGEGRVTPTRAKVKEFLQSEAQITTFIYNKVYKDENGSQRKFVPDGIVTLMPETPLGKTWFGTTPEEADLMGSSVANVTIVDGGVAVTTSKQVDPVNVSTKVSQICVPSFELADQVIIASVL